jgi:hypothetical protein
LRDLLIVIENCRDQNFDQRKEKKTSRVLIRKKTSSRVI